MIFLKEYLATYVMIPLLVMGGLYYSYRLKFPQFSKLKQALKLMFQKGASDSLSSFAAVAAVLGGNLGTGNIAGVAVALYQGGPGALFWMWVMALLGMVIKMGGCVLGVLYRHKTVHGRHVGGPMYYLKNGLKRPMLSKLYGFCLLAGALTVGNFVQMNSLALPLAKLDISPAVTGAVMSLLVAVVIFGGLRRFSVVVTKIVPLMAMTYLTIALYILGIHFQETSDAFLLVLRSAFTLEPVVGGVAGYGLLQVMNAGFDRGLFATDAGVGLAPIIHASVGAPKGMSLDIFARQQGLISMVSPVIVMVVCMITGLTLLVTGAWNVPGLQSTNACVEAFARGIGWQAGGHIVTITLALFAFTTILTWSFCADRAVGFLFGNRAINIFRAFFVAMLPLGALIDVTFVWTIADISMNFMFLINVMGLLLMSKIVVAAMHPKSA